MIGGARVVWWDPATLGLGRMSRGGLRGTAIFQEGEAGDERIEAHVAWHQQREATREEGATPSFRVSSVTAFAHAVEDGEASIAPRPPRIEEAGPARAEGPSGKRFGTLVHAILAECPLFRPRPT